ncbi:hypothetical protein JYU34_002674 [Plutella xylostella]|uniref:DUF4708 domain-containing protein n=1 Tax=Plutella xylostella TaxID=51655 RepID=A0ABQ7R2W5_PLUXY|nr:hypothetical protein JYU34_002674 [Plutella xylostella]
MIIFSNSSILASPDKNDIKRIHIIFNKVGDDYDKLNSLFLKFSLSQEGEIHAVTAEMFQLCFKYTITAKIAPVWNTLGTSYYINNRDFLTASGPQNGLQYAITSDDDQTILNLKGVKINFIKSKQIYSPGEWIRVLPSLNKAIVEEYCDKMPQSASFKCYKDLRRHWKNIHGYRLPEEEFSYYLIRFWRGEPMTYPQVCVIRDFPIITPVPKTDEATTVSRFIGYLKSKSPMILGEPLQIRQKLLDRPAMQVEPVNDRVNDTQAISLCTPTQKEIRPRDTY